MSWWIAVPLAVALVVGGCVLTFGVLGLIVYFVVKGLDKLDAGFGEGTAERIGAYCTLAACGILVCGAVVAVAGWLAS